MDATHIDHLVARTLLLRSMGTGLRTRCHRLLRSAAAPWCVRGAAVWRRPRVAAASLALLGCAAMAATGLANSPDAVLLKSAPASAATPASPDAVYNGVAAMLPRSVIPGYARPHIRPSLRDEERQAALQAGKWARSMDAATVAAVARSLLPVLITFPQPPDTIPAPTPAQTPVTIEPPAVYALATHVTRTRIASELRQQLMGSSVTVGELPGTPRTELMQVGEGWRAVVWPFATESDADKARHLLAERGIRTELLKF